MPLWPSLIGLVTNGILLALKDVSHTVSAESYYSHGAILAQFKQIMIL